MKIINLIMLFLFTVIPFIYSALAFMGKDIILDNTYTKASKEERETMDKDAFRRQGGVIFFALGLISLMLLLREILSVAWLTYVAGAIMMIGCLYAIVSHNQLKNKYDC